MAQAIVDPGELRRFAQMLRRFNEEINEKTAAVAGQLSHLGQSWRDQEHPVPAEKSTAGGRVSAAAVGHKGLATRV